MGCDMGEVKAEQYRRDVVVVGSGEEQGGKFFFWGFMYLGQMLMTFKKKVENPPYNVQRETLRSHWLIRELT